MKALKILTAVMGVMIVIGFAVIVVELIHRIQDSGQDPGQDPGRERDRAVVRGAEPYAVSIDVPADSRLAGIQAADDHLALTFRMPDGTTLITLVDPLTGEELGTISVPVDYSQPAGGTEPLWER